MKKLEVLLYNRRSLGSSWPDRTTWRYAGPCLIALLALAACTAPGVPARPAVATTASTAVVPAAAATAPAGWRTFTLPDAGYSLMLPPGVSVQSGKSAAGVYTARFQFDLPQASGYQGLVVRVEPNPGGQGLEDLVARLYHLSTLSPGEATPAELLAQAQTLALAGAKGVKVTTSGQDFTVVVPYGGRVYYVAPVHDMATTSLDPQAMQLFEQILATFRVSP